MAVGAGLYLPFAWIPGTLQPGEFSYLSPAWFKLWSVLPGFFPATYFFHHNEHAEMLVMIATTLVLLVGLTSLGSAGRWQFWVAVGLALLISIPSSLIVHACLVF